jgi:hypothetical protein
MINPVGGISLLDGLAALARVGVAERAAAARAVSPVLETTRRERDTVELSPAARQRAQALPCSECETAAKPKGSLVDVTA